MLIKVKMGKSGSFVTDIHRKGEIILIIVDTSVSVGIRRYLKRDGRRKGKSAKEARGERG